MRELCEWKGVNILKAEVCPDYIHMLVEIPPQNECIKFYGGFESSTMLYEQFSELKY